MSGRPTGTERPPVREMLDRIREDAPLTRRDYLRMLVTVSGGLLIGSAAVAFGVFRRRDRDATTEILVARSMVPGRSVRFDYPTDDGPAIAMRLADGALVAYSAVCTHLSCTVLWNRDEERLDCPCHDGTFDALDGRVLTGPPPRPLPKIELVERPDGIYAVGVTQGLTDVS